VAAFCISSDAAPLRQAPEETEASRNFAGKWILDGPERNGPWSPFGSRFTATQTQTALTISRFTTFTYDPDGPASLTTSIASEPEVFTFNAEARQTFQLQPPNLGPTFGLSTTERVSTVTRTGWEGDHLIITSHTVSRTTAPTQTPAVFETRESARLVVSLVGRNRVLVESVRIEDPVPWAVDQYMPLEVRRTFYNREGATDLSAWIETPRVTALRAKAAAGDGAAGFALGKRYAAGNDVPRDMPLAVSWYRNAAAHGSAAAEEALGSLYDEGIGVPRDSTRAVFDVARAGVRARHPNATEHERSLRLAVEILGSDLAARAYPDVAGLSAPEPGPESS
jgi:hypothetical protein